MDSYQLLRENTTDALPKSDSEATPIRAPGRETLTETMRGPRIYRTNDHNPEVRTSARRGSPLGLRANVGRLPGFDLRGDGVGVRSHSITQKRVATSDLNRVAAAKNTSTNGGTKLPEHIRSRFEASLGVDLSSVRVHTGATSATAAKGIRAKAYTVGGDIHFDEGQYDPSSAEGQMLLAHEVAHTVQQTASRDVQAKLTVSSPGDVFEDQADQAAEAMVVGRSFDVAPMASSPQIMRKPAPTPVRHPDEPVSPYVNPYTDVEETPDKIRWKEKTTYTHGEVVEEKSAPNLYGPKAKALSWEPDPADPFAVTDVPDWNVRAVGPASPPAFGVSFAVKQPLPVRRRVRLDSSPAQYGTKDWEVDGYETIPVQESQLAFAQKCVNAFRGPFQSAQSSWNAMAPQVRSFAEAGANPDFWEGGMNWLSSTSPSKADQAGNLEDLANKQKLGHPEKGNATHSMSDIKKLSTDDASALEGEEGDKTDVLQKKAGEAAQSRTAIVTAVSAVKLAVDNESNLKMRLQNAVARIDLSKLEANKDKEESKLKAAKAKQSQIKATTATIVMAIDLGVSVFSGSGIAQLSYAALKMTATKMAGIGLDHQIKQGAATVANLAQEIQGLSNQIDASALIAACQAAQTAAERIGMAKAALIDVLTKAEIAHNEFADAAGKQAGGNKGELVRAALEALPKVRMLVSTIEGIVAAISVPAFSREAGIGMLGASTPTGLFAIRASQLAGYKTTYESKLNTWKPLLAKLEGIAQSYGLGD